MVVYSIKADGDTWSYSALAWAARKSQIGVMGLLIQLGGKTDGGEGVAYILRGSSCFRRRVPSRG